MTERSQLVRDLLWVVNSPSFCDGPDIAPPHSLMAEEVDDDALDAFMASRREHRVGRYFEHLLLYWLTEIRHVEMVGHGVQIRDGKQTIGEIDYLFRDETGDLVHCEASVKFFLHHPRPATSHFPGPNATDSYERKVSKLFEQQLELSRVHYPDVAKRQAFVKGMVFYRSDAPVPSVLPIRMPASHLRGRWFRESELDGLVAGASVAGSICDKPNWLAPGPPSQAKEIEVLVDELKTHFVAKGYPVMLNLFTDGGSTAERCFVVADQWPNPKGAATSP